MHFADQFFKRPGRSRAWLMSVLLAWMGLAAGSDSSATAADPKDVFEARTFKGEGETELRYRLMKPEDYDPKKKYPLVLFLHGAGERGDDNTIQLVHGMADFARDDNRDQYRCFVMAPQCPKNKKWVEVDWSQSFHDMPEEPSESIALTMQAIDALKKEFGLDEERFYVTGLSMGGYGTWDLISRYPDKFAAAVPICGGGDEVYAARLTKIPIWAFHGTLDKAVPPQRSRRMIKAIEVAGGKPKYTEYPEVGHDSWVKAYSDPEMLAWLFSQQRKSSK